MFRGFGQIGPILHNFTGGVKTGQVSICDLVHNIIIFTGTNPRPA